MENHLASRPRASATSGRSGGPDGEARWSLSSRFVRRLPKEKFHHFLLFPISKSLPAELGQAFTNKYSRQRTDLRRGLLRR